MIEALLLIIKFIVIIAIAVLTFVGFIVIREIIVNHKHKTQRTMLNLFNFKYFSKGRMLKLMDMELEHLQKARSKHITISRKLRKKLKDNEMVVDLIAQELLRRKGEGVDMIDPALPASNVPVEKDEVSEQHTNNKPPHIFSTGPISTIEEENIDEEEEPELVIHSNYKFKVK